MPTSIGGLPTRLPSGAPSSVDQAVGDELPDELGDRHPGESGGAGEVGAAGRTVGEERLEQQRAVVATGVLLEELPLRPQGPADRVARRRHVS